jgi:sodium-coupled neutral amino acid transporter 9
MTTKAPITVVALMNAMIGGTVLVLPLLFLRAGLVPSVIATIITGLINYNACRICLKHLQNDKDLPDCIYRHTKSRVYPKIYDTAVYISLQLILLLYFSLVIEQWNIIMNRISYITTLINGVLVFILVFVMRKFDMSVSLLGYGILSIFGYMIFLVWLLASAPSGTNKFPLTSWKFTDVYDALATAFGLQGIYVPVLRKN